MPPSVPGSLLSLTLTTISNHFKPHRAEALQRIRLNGICLSTLLLSTYLLPLPSVLTALKAVLVSGINEAWTVEWIYKRLCAIELLLVVILVFNILQAVYAVKYPLPPLPPTPAKKKTGIKSAPATPQRPFKILSPNSSPQPQKPFAFSPSSFSISSSNISYAMSPVSTPSRVMQYSNLASSPTNARSTSTSTSVGFLSTPSPIVTAYRGKHASSVGRALDGSYLGQIGSDNLEEE